MVSLSLKTNSEMDWTAAFSALSDFCMSHNESFSYISLSTTDIDDLMNAPDEDEEVVFTENTMAMVYDAIRYEIRKTNFNVQSHQAVEDIVNALRNAGILFRERAK